MKKLILLLLVTVTALTACSKLNGSYPHHDRLQSLLLKDTIKMYVGETKAVPLSVTPSDYQPDSLKYISSDTTVITISDIGTLVAKKVGISEITISNFTNTISVKTKITVIPAPIDSLKLGLIAYYPLNNSTADSSGIGNNGTGYNLVSVADRFGNANSAYSFDGIDSYIYIADNLQIRLYKTDFTQNAWVKLNDYNQSYGSVILGKRIPGTVDAGYTFSIGGYTSSSLPDAGIAHFGPGGGSNNNALGTKVIALNQWHMVTCIYSYSNQSLAIYIDGVLDDISPNIMPPDASIGAGVFIGRDDPTFQDNGYFINGALDDIRVYDRALSKDEVQKLYNLTY